MLSASILIAGTARGQALVLEEALSFLGGFNPANGEIIDVHHPQYQQMVRDKILFIPQSRGSAGTPGGIAETLRNGTGPRAFILGERDVNIGVGTLVANRLYGLDVPVLKISHDQMRKFCSGDRVAIDLDGSISIL